jgi:hypothetical protein
MRQAAPGPYTDACSGAALALNAECVPGIPSR